MFNKKIIFKIRIFRNEYIFFQKITVPNALENINELWIDVKKVDGVWKISGVKELSKFESDWAPDEPKNQTNLDCAYLSKQNGYDDIK